MLLLSQVKQLELQDKHYPLLLNLLRAHYKHLDGPDPLQVRQDESQSIHSLLEFKNYEDKHLLQSVVKGPLHS